MGRAHQAVGSRAPQNAAATRAVNFINGLVHTKGEWASQPFRLRPWQERLVRQLFGTLLPDRKTRQYRTCYVEIPRKNGKTELAAAIALYMLLGDPEKGAEIYGAAVDLEQASLAFNVAAAMLRSDPELLAEIDIIPSRRRIVHYGSGSFYRAIPAEAPSAHGYNASAVIYDELHAAPNRELWDVLTTSMGARRQPLTFVITTAGYDRKSICWELHDYAVKVRDNVLTDRTFLPVLYGAPDDADWLDEAVWRVTNPALGDFRSLEEMRTMARQAKEIPARQNTFRRLYLCQWTESETRWFDADTWAEEGGAPLTLEDLRGRRCFLGLDLSSTTDLTAAVLVALDDDGGVVVVPTFWVPAENIHGRARRDRVPYAEWARTGALETTEGNVVDYDAILAWVLSLPEEHGIEVLNTGFDPWNATSLVTKLQEAGVPCTPVRQGFQSLSGPSKHLEALVVSRKLRHGRHPVLAWCASNVVTEQDPSGNIKPSKRKSTERIDGIVALVTALAVALVSVGSPMGYYDTHDVRMA